jgi:putative transposase
MAQRAYRYRVVPTAEQEAHLRRLFGCVRWVWNDTLAEQRRREQAGERRLGYGATSARLTARKHEPDLVWLSEVSSVPLQQALRHLHAAHLNWWQGRAAEPVFKRKHDRHQAAEFTRSAFSWEPTSRSLVLAKIGRLRVRWSRPLPRGCRPSTVTLTRDPAGRTFVSLVVDEAVAPLPPTNRVTGLDRGLSAWVTTPEGETFGNSWCYARMERRLARAQRAMNRKQRSSNNRERARIRVARLHARIADARRDALHKLTWRIVSENQAIALETLHVRGLLRNHALAKAINDAAWGELGRQISYKAGWYGRRVVQACPWFPSTKRCSACGLIGDTLPLDVRVWTCQGCGTAHDRDTNAAKNLVQLLADDIEIGPAVGHTVAACGGLVRPGLATAGHGATRGSRNPRQAAATA